MSKNTKRMVYVIYADTHDDGYGAMIEIFGVTDNHTDSQKICEMVEKDGYDPKVEYIPLNEFCQRYLGGYFE